MDAVERVNAVLGPLPATEALNVLEVVRGRVMALLTPLERVVLDLAKGRRAHTKQDVLTFLGQQGQRLLFVKARQGSDTAPIALEPVALTDQGFFATTPNGESVHIFMS